MADPNLIFAIYNEDGSAFHNLSLKKSTYTSTVMSLDDKIEGDVFYANETLEFTFKEYVMYNGVKYSLRIDNPPTILKKGMTKDNNELGGMAKYSLTFYHPSSALYNIPFTDVAVSADEKKYKSEDTDFYWIGTLTDLAAKIDKNLESTLWHCSLQTGYVDSGKQSQVLQFANQKISDVLKTAYDEFKIPFVVDGYNIYFGAPVNEVLIEGTSTPYVFEFGQGLGLKNSDRTPRNNEVITRIAGYGLETNIPYGYPKIQWTGIDAEADWDYTINNDPNNVDSYPIIDGVIDGVNVRLINHPFTRKVLMPTIYVDNVNKKVNPKAVGYDPDTVLVDYYDAISDVDRTYPTPINPLSPSYTKKEFDVKPTIENATYQGQAIDVIKSISWINDDGTPATGVDDTFDSNTGKYKQGNLQIEFYPLGFDLYAMAAVTSAMSVNIKSGDCSGCTFELEADWDAVKKSFYVNGIFTPQGTQRDLTLFPISTNASISVIVKKDINTFGTVYPNIYQKPIAGDKFVFLGIDMPSIYISDKQTVLDNLMKDDMLANNTPYYEYPLEFDNYFLTTNTYILNQIKTNCVIRSEYAGASLALYVKELSISWGGGALPTYKISLTDNIEVVSNAIGQVVEGLNKLETQTSSAVASATSGDFSRNVRIGGSLDVAGKTTLHSLEATSGEFADDIHTTKRVIGDEGVFAGGIGDLYESGGVGVTGVVEEKIGNSNVVTGGHKNGSDIVFEMTLEAYSKDDTNDLLDTKVDKVAGYGLSQNNLTDEIIQSINNSASAYTHSQITNGTNPHATTFANIANKPTTISGYGITDAYTKTYIDDNFVPYVGALKDVNLGDYSLSLFNLNASNNIHAEGGVSAGGIGDLAETITSGYNDILPHPNDTGNAVTSISDNGGSTLYYRMEKSFSEVGHNHNTVYQPLDSDLTAIAGLTGTSGLLKKTAANTWALDTNTYLTGITKAQVEDVLTGAITSHTHNYQAPLTGTGFVKSAAGVISYDTNIYLTAHQTIYGLTIQKNGTTIATYTPNSAAKTINISDVASASTLDSHISNISNPHSVTKTQVGLGNVEDTKLSTWAGTDSITTLGTISSGTWNATKIGVSKGGTGKTSIAIDRMLYASSANTYEEVITTSFGRGILSAISETEVAGLRAATATKLASSVYLWGNEFNGTQSLDGHIESIGDIHTTQRIYGDTGVYAGGIGDLAESNSGGYNNVEYDDAQGVIVDYVSNVVSNTSSLKVYRNKLKTNLSQYIDDLGVNPIHSHSQYMLASLKGIANGLAELDSNGLVPASQLPSYVDDVLTYTSLSAFPATGIDGKIYITSDTNLTYRWSGTAYVEISKSLALGETVSTAYRGDRGKIAYDHSQASHTFSIAGQNINALGGSISKATLLSALNVADGAQVNILEGVKLNNTLLTPMSKIVNVNACASITVPTGLSVAALTTGGLIAISLATGYAIPTSVNIAQIATNAANITTLQGYFIDGSAKTALKLTTAVAINGTNFDGSASITTTKWGTARSIGIINSDGSGTAITVSVDGSNNINLKLPASIKAALEGNATSATKLQTTRALTIGATAKNFDGSAAVSWSLAEIGAAAVNQTMYIGTTAVAINRASGAIVLTGITSIDGNAATANKVNRILTRGTYLTGNNFDGSANTTWSVDATSANTPNKVVVRDANGDFAAGNINGQRIYGDAGVFSGGIGDLSEVGGSGYNDILPYPNESGNAVTYLEDNGSTLYYHLGNFSLSTHNHNSVYSLLGHIHTISEITSLQTSLNAKESTIVAGTTAQYWRGDKSWQALNTSAVAEGSNLYFTNARVKSYTDTLYSVLGHNHSGVYQPLDSDLTAIAGLTGTSGFLKKTAANTWSLDTNVYLTGNQTITLSGIITGSGTTSISTSIADSTLSIAKTSGLQSALNAKMATSDYPDLVAIEALSGTSGLLKKTAANTWSLDTAAYITGITKAMIELQLTGNITSHTHSHTHSQYLTAHQTIYSLIIQKNGVTIDTFVPNSAAKTINISDVASAATLASHTANVSNPHSVTKTQVGLGNVENAAASGLYVPLTRTVAGLALSSNIATSSLKSALGLGSAAYRAENYFSFANHTHGNVTNAGYIGSTANLPIITGTGGILQVGSFGTTANTFCQGNDSRLSNARIASDVYAWAKASAKPSYTYTEVGAAAASHTHTYLTVSDTRAVVSVPQDLQARALQVDFKNNTSVGNPTTTANVTYSHIISFAGWNVNEPSGGWPSQLSIGDGIAVRQATSATTWGVWRNLYHTGNLNKSTLGLGNVDNTADASKNVLSATKLYTGRTLKVNLASTSASTSFNGTANITDIGVSGILSTSNGGTGNNTFVSNKLIYAQSATKLSSMATTLGSISVPVYLNVGAITACTSSQLFSKLSWNNGTTSGPTLNITVTEQNRTSVIPSASASYSGIVTTGSQTFAGSKTFSSTIIGSINGNANTVDNLHASDFVRLTGSVTQNITGLKTFNSTVSILDALSVANSINAGGFVQGVGGVFAGGIADLGGSEYVIPTASAASIGGIKIGYTNNAKNYKVNLDASGNAFVNVSWVNTTYSAGDWINISGTTISNLGTWYLGESSQNGYVTVYGGVNPSGYDIPIHGLGSAAYTNSSAYASSSHNHSGVYEPVISTKNTAFNVNFGTAVGTACQGNDSRLSNARTPSSHSHGNITNGGYIGSTANLPIITGTGGVLRVGSFGSAANTFCQGNDSRLSDSRVASDVSAWAKASTKPSYTYSEVGAASSSHNHSGVYEPVISTKNTAFNVNFGTTSGTACQGNDSRLSNARTPSAHTHSEYLSEGSWTTPTLTNATQGTTYGAVRYRKIGTNVQIDGSFTITISNTDGVRIFQLPTGYRPVHKMSMLMYNNSAGIWRCVIGTDGQVWVNYIYKISDGSLITVATTCMFDKCIFPIN